MQTFISSIGDEWGRQLFSGSNRDHEAGEGQFVTLFLWGSVFMGICLNNWFCYGTGLVNHKHYPAKKNELNTLQNQSIWQFILIH